LEAVSKSAIVGGLDLETSAANALPISINAAERIENER